jgi:polysaccharide biosynthesis transport protein
LTAETHPTLDLRRVLRAGQRWAWLIAALVVGSFVLIYLGSSVRTSMYTSVSEVRITPPADTPKDPKFIGNEIYNIRGAGVRQGVAIDLGSDMALVAGIEVSEVAETDVIAIAVTSSSPEVAQRAADSYAEQYEQLRRSQLISSYTDQAEELQNQADAVGEEVNSLEAEIQASQSVPDNDLRRQQIADLRAKQRELLSQASDAQLESRLQGDRVRVEKTANLPAFADSPTPLRDAGVAAAVALVFAIGLVFLLEQLDNRIKSPDQVLKASGGVPLLGSVSVYSTTRRTTRKFHAAQRTLVPPTSPAAESYRTLATSLRFSSLGKEKRTILITSSSGGEGKTTVTANLAAVLAENGLRVVVVSADLRRPMLGQLLGIEESAKGLTSAMLGDRDLSSCFESVSLPSGRSMFVLPAGPLPHEPAVLLGSDMFGTVLEQIKKAGADFILVDCAPVLPVSDPLAASRHVDGVIVVTLHGKTKEANLSETVDRLRQLDADIIGVVLNGVPTAGQYAYSNFYGYASYEPTKPPPPPSASASDDPSGTNGTSGSGVPTSSASEPTGFSN